jgi:hypothetical protein
VELDDEELTNYCMWFNTLDARHQGEWNRMLGRLRPKLKTRALPILGREAGEEQKIRVGTCFSMRSIRGE